MEGRFKKIDLQYSDLKPKVDFNGWQNMKRESHLEIMRQI